MQPRRNYQSPQRNSEPTHPWSETRVNAVQEPYSGSDPTLYAYPRPRRQRSRLNLGCGCIPLLLLSCPILVALALYLFLPVRTNMLILGIDYTDPSNAIARSDTLILSTVVPLEPYVGMLSIPRDLWVNIPGVGENHINTAHFFAEAQQTGAGPQAALETIRQNFGVDVRYYVRIRFESAREIVNALGGVTIDMPVPMAGYEAGRHHLNGNKALAFARSRAGADDFFRMEHGQLLVKSIIRQMLSPVSWPRLPAVFLTVIGSVDTNIPIWQWPRLGLALLRAGPEGIDSRTINRDMAQGIITDQGANVLLPNWGLINPVLMEMFGQ